MENAAQTSTDKTNGARVGIEGVEPKKMTKYQKYRAANREKLAARGRAYVAANRAKVYADNKRWRDDNIDKVRERDKARYWANREKRLARMRQAYEANKEKYLQRNKIYRRDTRYYEVNSAKLSLRKREKRGSERQSKVFFQALAAMSAIIEAQTPTPTQTP